MALFRKNKSESELLADFANMMNNKVDADSKRLFDCCNELVKKYNNSEARLQLAKFYAEDFQKVGIQPNVNQAIVLITPLVDENNISGLKYASKLYKPFDAKFALSCIKKAADLGDAESCFTLGQAYETGNELVEKSNSNRRRMNMRYI